VICGTGGTGAVGLAAARALGADGAAVEALVVGEHLDSGSISPSDLEMASRTGVRVTVARVAPDEQAARVLDGADLAVDALLGTGVDGDLRGPQRAAIEAILRARVPVVSVDLPSGVDGDTGQVLGVAVRAVATVALGAPTLGAVLHPGAGLAGRLHVASLSMPPDQRDAGLAISINAPPPLPPRRAEGHKGTFGDVLFVAGAAGYLGAPGFAALSMLRAGGGYSRLAAPRSIVPHVASWASEVVFLPQAETASGSLSLAAAERLLELAEAVDLVVVGPGLSVDPETQALVRELVPRIAKPLLVDGDGLTAVAADPEVLRRRGEAATALTPHPGEMSRLVGRSIAEIRADPVGTVRRAAADLGAAVVLKGARSLIGFPDGRVLINPTGNSGLGTAGSGDVLDGTIAAMLGLGLELGDAVAAGVFVHGLAGDLAAAELGEDGVTARDVMAHLPAAVRRYRAARDELVRDVYRVAEPV
jgi:NAD(P)H-hydrate epimerase